MGCLCWIFVLSDACKLPARRLSPESSPSKGKQKTHPQIQSNIKSKPYIKEVQKRSRKSRGVLYEVRQEERPADAIKCTNNIEQNLELLQVKYSAWRSPKRHIHESCYIVSWSAISGKALSWTVVKIWSSCHNSEQMQRSTIIFTTVLHHNSPTISHGSLHSQQQEPWCLWALLFFRPLPGDK